MRITLAAIAACIAASASGEEAPSFPAVVMQAERSSPRLMELAADVSIAEGHAQQAGVWPMPLLALEREDFGGSGPYSGSSRAQSTVSISEPLELGGQRGARIDAGRSAVAAAQARQVQLRAEFGYELAVAYATAEATQARVDLLSEDLGRAKEDVRSARALVEAGKEGELRAVQAEAAASAAQADLEAARADGIAALTRLSTLAGVGEPYSHVAPSLLNLSRHPNAEAPRSNEMPSAPLIARAQAERDSSELRLTVEKKRAIPTPSFSVGRRRYAEDDAGAWVAGFSIPLPLTDRNRGEIAAAQSELRAADARLAAARLEADGQWRTANAEADAAASRLAASQQGETSAREAYRLARIGYEAGRTPLIELLGTRRAFTDAQLRSLDARVARVRAEASLARLAGRIPFAE